MMKMADLSLSLGATNLINFVNLFPLFVFSMNDVCLFLSNCLLDCKILYEDRQVEPGYRMSIQS